MASILGCPYCLYPIAYPMLKVQDGGELIKQQDVECRNCKAVLEVSLKVKKRPTAHATINKPSG